MDIEDKDNTEIFDFINKKNWFPGHMERAEKELTQRIKIVDLILEVRDARIPLSSRNERLEKIIGTKKRIILFSKKDLIEPHLVNCWQSHFRNSLHPTLFIDIFEKKSLKRLLAIIHSLLKHKAERYLSRKIQPPPSRIIIIGIPNSGKSTLVNQLTHKKQARTGNLPGVTQKTTWFILEKKLELLDTPGIVPPCFSSPEQALKLSCAHSIKEEIIPNNITAIFLLELLLNRNPKPLQKHYNLETLGTQVTDLLIEQLAVQMNHSKQNNTVNKDKVYQQLLNDFRSQRLGKISLEIPEDDRD